MPWKTAATGFHTAEKRSKQTGAPESDGAQSAGGG